MKKILRALLLFPAFAVAQSQFVTPTTYRGAFAPAPEPMWTNNWCNWDPQYVDYIGSNTPVEITSNITTNTTWTSNNVYLLLGQIYVKNGATLTIQAGTVVMGDYNTAGSGLFITQGAKLLALGTASAPVVFTSSQPPGSRISGDWGGIVLMGKAGNNVSGGTANIEGIAPVVDTQFGGGGNPDNNDNSGILQYVRIEYPGYVYQPNKEINGLTLGSVGKGTTIDHIQVSFANDDSFEWFGGTVNCKYLVAYRGLDDDFDTDNGYSGTVQFGLAVREPQVSDNPSVSTSEGFESDNDASGTTATPQTSALFTNMTIIGPFRGNPASTVASGYRRGARLRRNTALKIFNSIFMDHPRGIHIDGTAAEDNATNGVLKFRNNIVAGNSAGLVCERNSGSTFNIWNWFSTSNNDSIVSTAGILSNPYPSDYATGVDYRPGTSSPALSNSDFSDAAFNGLVVKENEAMKHQMAVYPNPANEQATIEINLKTREIITAYVCDVTGKQLDIFAQQLILPTGITQFKLDLNNYDQGIYFVVINAGDYSKSLKLSVSKK